MHNKSIVSVQGDTSHRKVLFYTFSVVLDKEDGPKTSAEKANPNNIYKTILLRL